MAEEGTQPSKLIFSFKALHDQQIPKHLQLQQKQTTVRVRRYDNNGILIEVTKT